MTEAKTTTEESPKVEKRPTGDTYFFPEYGVSVVANSLEEARKLVKKPAEADGEQE